MRYDLDDDRSIAHHFEPDRIPGEAVFVPRDGATDEDDGYLLMYVYDKTANSSDFVVLDAADPASAPIARVSLPPRVPSGCHGSWIPDPE